MVEKLSVKDAFLSHGMLKGSFTETVGHTRDAILKREAEIIASLKSGPKTCDQLDNILYRPVVLELCPWFSSVTESHLVELEKSGVVRKDGLEYSSVD
jgi:hypothetical protein